MLSHVGTKVLADCTAQAQADGIQKLVVGAAIHIDGKFLVLERDPADFMGGLVELPSGTVDPGEETLTALAREVVEETGLTITVVAKYLGSFDYTSGSGKKTRQFNFLVEVDPGEIKLNPAEHRAHYLVLPSDPAFQVLNISDATKSVLLAALAE